MSKTLRSTAWAGCLAMALVCSTALAGGVPSLGDSDLGKGAFSKMHMLLEKTVLKVDVATIDVRVDPKTETKLAELSKGKPYSSGLEKELANATLAAEGAVIQLKFVRDVSLDQWIDGVRESLEKAQEAGMIDGGLRAKVSSGLPEWFKALKDSGFHDGDRVLYKITPGQLRTVAVLKDGRVAVDRNDTGTEKTKLVLASYFAPGTDYRELLLRSLGK
jgi:hypothetical protein